jgi:hypothetical protein
MPAIRIDIPTTNMYVVRSNASSVTDATFMVWATKKTATPAAPRKAPFIR